MRILLIFIGLIVIGQHVSSQERNDIEIDSLYKEDQFYVGVTYNLLGKRQDKISQSGFSTGFHFGFIKDMPINKRRNVAIGVGLGYSANSFNQDLRISKDNLGNINYTVLEDKDTYSKNKFAMQMVELPLEFRWRTSNATDYNFWRIYTGFKLGYVFATTTKYKGDLGNEKHKNIEDFNDLQYGLTVSLGYNTWNLYLYYALNPVFSSNAQLDGGSIDINALKVGLMFYIL